MSVYENCEVMKDGNFRDVYEKWWLDFLLITK